MWRARLAMAAGLALAGCIPQVDPPYGDAPPPQRAESRVTEREPELSAAAETDARIPMGERRHRAPPPDQDESEPGAAEDHGLSAPRPVWEARPVTPDAETVPDSTYTVRPGDTLARIAERTGTNEAAIGQANDLVPPFKLAAGTRLRVPGGRYHVVRQGQSGIAIARAYGVEWSRIVAANDLAEPYALVAGQRLRIPGTPAGSTTLADRAAAFQLDIEDILTGGEPAARPDQAPAKPARSSRRVLPPTAVVAAPARLRGGFLWPVDGQVVKRFGPDADGERNNGIQIAVPMATPIHAVADGVVAYAGSGVAALGGLVIVRHGDRWSSVYGHASKLLVRRGQSVRQGQTIALSGDTGTADLPELHFELRKGRTPVDPQSELPRT